MSKEAYDSPQKPNKSSELVAAICDLLPPHTLACVSQPDPQTTPWTFHADENGKPLVTEKSCRCETRIKEIRRMIPDKHPKGFSLNAKDDSPPIGG